MLSEESAVRRGAGVEIGDLGIACLCVWGLLDGMGAWM